MRIGCCRKQWDDSGISLMPAGMLLRWQNAGVYSLLSYQVAHRGCQSSGFYASVTATILVANQSTEIFSRAKASEEYICPVRGVCPGRVALTLPPLCALGGLIRRTSPACCLLICRQQAATYAYATISTRSGLIPFQVALLFWLPVTRTLSVCWPELNSGLVYSRELPALVAA